MTASLGNFQNGSYGSNLDGYVYPQFLFDNKRAPTTNDKYPAGTRWQDSSVSPPIIYQTTGNGAWLVATGAGVLTALTVTGTTALTGTTTINTSGSAVTTIGTGGTGAVKIGNATGNTQFTGNIVASTTLTATLGAITATNGNLVLGTAGNKLSIATGANASIGVSGALAASAVTVTTTAVTASSKIFITRAAAAGTLGNLSIGTITAGVSFTITTDNVLDTSTVNWIIIN